MVHSGPEPILQFAEEVLELLAEGMTNQQIADRLTGQGIPVLDLFPPFLQQIDQTGEAFHFKEDKHWNVAGNRLAGETMADWVADNFD